MNNKLVFTSYGLTTGIGRKLISKELMDYNLVDKKIFLFYEPYYSIESILFEECIKLGFEKENIILSGRQKSNKEVVDCDFYYCTEGNTFEILSLLRESGVDSLINEGFKKGHKIYIGCSAGATIAGVSVEVAKNFDMNTVGITDFEGLKLFDGIIIPHYTKHELRQYISYRPDMKEKYKLILSVSNEKSLVLEV